MGRTKRRYQGELLRFRKTLKRPLRNILATMPEGFSEELFLSEFKLLYSYFWDDICSKAKEYNRKDKGRKKDYLKYISSQNLSVICDLLLYPLFIMRDYTINLRSQRRSELSLGKIYLNRVYASKKTEKIK